ncbi:Imm8 family immunity protein [Sphingomonas rosea]
MRAELKGIHSVDAELESYVPDNDAFCVLVTAQIGTLGSKEADNFNFYVCSPQWLSLQLETDKVVSGRHHFFMSEFDLASLEAYVVKRVRQAEGADWAAIAAKLARWSHWEFEDYAGS